MNLFAQGAYGQPVQYANALEGDGVTLNDAQSPDGGRPSRIRGCRARCWTPSIFWWVEVSSDSRRGRTGIL